MILRAGWEEDTGRASSIPMAYRYVHPHNGVKANVYPAFGGWSAFVWLHNGLLDSVEARSKQYEYTDNGLEEAMLQAEAMAERLPSVLAPRDSPMLF